MWKPLGIFQEWIHRSIAMWSSLMHSKQGKKVAEMIGGNKNGCKTTAFETQVLDRWEGKEMVIYCVLT